MPISRAIPQTADPYNSSNVPAAMGAAKTSTNFFNKASAGSSLGLSGNLN